MPLRSTAFFAALAVLACAVAAPVPLARVEGRTPVYREIKNWVVACDNLGTCVAKFARPDSTDKDGYLSVTREAGARGKLTVNLIRVTLDGPPYPDQLKLDGHRFGAGLSWREVREDNAIQLGGEAAMRFLAALRNGHMLSYPAKEIDETVSLDGMTAALLAIDEIQGRVGTVTALIRPGARPASAVPEPPPMPVVHAVATAEVLPRAAQFAAQVRRLQGAALKANDCEPDQAVNDKADLLNAREVIVSLGCMLGAKHANALLFRVPRDDPRAAKQLVLPLQPTLAPRGAYGGLYVSDEGWDPKTATFDEADVGTAMNDCGTSTQWAFDGRDFQLVSFSRSDRCAGPPGDLLDIYRSKLVVVQAR